MPGFSGYDVRRRIRENSATATLPVAVTALDPGTERIKGTKPADDFVTKPLNQPELLARSNRFFASSRPRSAED
jgi:DNA-binding response OmpR family regulator